MTIPSVEIGSINERLCDLTKWQAHCALETATLRRFGERRNSIPLGKSSEVEVAMETKTIGASRPWNLSKVPTAIRWKPFLFMSDLSSFTWAL